MTLVELTGSRLDDWWQRVSADPRVAAAWRWGAPALVLLVAAVTRLAWLGLPHEVVFDETYYVKDAWTLSHLGYEAGWPADANGAFAAGDVDGYRPDDPSFIAHPPLGKWIIALGMLPSGGQDPFGWRVSVAICGILLVAATMLLARLLLGSHLLAVIAGGLLAIDGNAIVMSRVGLLDSILALLALLGAICVLVDRRWSQARLAEWLGRRDPRPTDWGPVLWRRPWLIAAAALFGAAASVKWSGLYFLAVFAVYSVLSDAVLRRQAGVAFWLTGTMLRQGPASFLLTVPLAAAVYLGSWTGWFVSDGGYYRHWAEQDGNAWTGPLSWVPTAFQSWWHYQEQMYGYNTSESSPHPYAANPLGWLLMIRPTSMYYTDFEDGTAATILDVANPVIWWAGAAAILGLLGIVIVRLTRGQRVAPYAFILTGIVAGYLPWMLYLHRTVFFFYVIAFEPYLVLALVAVIGLLIGHRDDPAPRRSTGLAVVGGFLVLCTVVSLYFYPVWTGEIVPTWFLQSHFWFPTWV